MRAPSAHRFGVAIIGLWVGMSACLGAHPHPQPDEPEGVVGLRPDGALGGPQATASPGELDGDQDPTRQERQERVGQLWYHLSLTGQGQLQVRMRLLEPAARVSLFLPGPWAGSHDYARALRITGVVGPSGERPMTLLRDQGRLDIDARDQAWIELTYEVSLKERQRDQDRFWPQRLGRSGVFAYAPTFLILPSERVARAQRQIPVEVQLPAGLEVATTWPLVRQAAPSRGPGGQGLVTRGYLAPDVGALRDAFLAASAELKLRRSERMGLTLAFDASYQGDQAGMLALVERVLTSYQARFGAVGDVHVLVRSPPQTAPWGAGRRGGFVLELPAHTALDDDARLLIAHEAFHLWNGHQLVPEPAHEQRTRWFKEGLTHYVALQALGQLGLSPARRLLDEVALASHHHALRASSDAPSASLLAREPYDRGLLLAMALDLQLRQSSQGKRTLDDWLRHLLSKAAQRPRWLYDEDQLLESLKAIDSSPALMTLWSQHVRQAKPLELTSLHQDLGLHWLPAAGKRPARLIPLVDAPARYEALLGLR